ncbi:hypothetical protein B0H63DRAFT_140418 [Podospora didyma]|uniref:Uncharacterized protein n=1 Tax=Podospora didyma TaxID=330526 RepID=A0AAE0NSJ9_9PEZI|nr:hypothetical protein B0H63DRAFT_140418 [Podospora didyma]
MCRHIVFAGKCSQCGGAFTWVELSQELRCLEAKNAGQLGECRRGVAIEEHNFDQECDPCLAKMEADEGYGGTEEEDQLYMGLEADEVIETTETKGKTEGRKANADDDVGDEDGRRSKKQRTI